MTDGMDVINEIEPGLYQLANMLDLLTDLTLDLGSDGTGRGPTDRVHALATACLACANSRLSQIEVLTEHAREAVELSRTIDEVEERAELATIRAERAEQSLRNITQELDRAHREIDQIKQAGKVPA